ncbi:MAG: response regulator [Chitinophagaceae bacterium]|nr:response regulator [Anaerolineae bacterium]
MCKEVWALIIEDDAHSLIAISSLMKELGIRYKRNTTGANVAALINVMEPRPDFILLDTDLPDGDAFSICREIRNNPYTAHIPIIAISDEFSAKMTQKARECGVTATMLKPLPRKDFSTILGSILGNNRSQDQAAFSS